MRSFERGVNPRNQKKEKKVPSTGSRDREKLALVLLVLFLTQFSLLDNKRAMNHHEISFDSRPEPGNVFVCLGLECFGLRRPKLFLLISISRARPALPKMIYAVSTPHHSSGAHGTEAYSRVFSFVTSLPLRTSFALAS